LLAQVPKCPDEIVECGGSGWWWFWSDEREEEELTDVLGDKIDRNMRREEPNEALV
jgi:hypothetical protein